MAVVINVNDIAGRSYAYKYWSGVAGVVGLVGLGIAIISGPLTLGAHRGLAYSRGAPIVKQ